MILRYITFFTMSGNYTNGDFCCNPDQITIIIIMSIVLFFLSIGCILYHWLLCRNNKQNASYEEIY